MSWTCCSADIAGGCAGFLIFWVQVILWASLADIQQSRRCEQCLTLVLMYCCNFGPGQTDKITQRPSTTTSKAGSTTAGSNRSRFWDLHLDESTHYRCLQLPIELLYGIPLPYDIPSTRPLL